MFVKMTADILHGIELVVLGYSCEFQPCFFFPLWMANGSIDVAPVGCHWMNYVTASVGYEGDCAGRKSTHAAVVTTDNITSVFTYTLPCKSSACMHAV